MALRVLIVDDEPLAREGVALQLRKDADVDIVGECENGNDAILAIAAHKPDLVFLDIRMPKLSGFDVIKRVGAANMPLVIFLTAYDEYAIDAFRYHALDYLLKPLDKALFKDSLHKARLHLQKDRQAAQAAQLAALLASLSVSAPPAKPALPPRIAIKIAGQVHLLLPDELQWVESEGDYVNVHTAGKSHLVRESMQAMEKKLEPYGFARIHRSAIVNLSKVSRLVTTDSGDYEVQLSGGPTIKVGRLYRDALLTRVGAGP